MKEKKREEQLKLIEPASGPYELPPLTFLESENQETAKIDEQGLRMNAKLLEKKLADYGVEGRITEIHPGPIITLYEFEPASGTKVNKVVNLEDDLSLTLGGRSVRIVPHLPGKPAVGIEVPNHDREIVWLKDIIASQPFQKSSNKIPLAFGSNVFVSTDRDVPGARMERLSGTFLTRVFEGPYRDAGKWKREMDDYAHQQGDDVEKTYFFYATCPRCAKQFGKNQVVLFAKVK
jgi:hypothetical protein